MKNSSKKNHYCLYSHVKQWMSVLLVLCIFPLASHAQNWEITLDLKDVTLENAVTQIASQAKVSVAYSKEFVDKMCIRDSILCVEIKSVPFSKWDTFVGS